MEATWKDYIGVCCIVIYIVLFYVRKIILTKYGYKMDIIDSMLVDFKRFKEVIATKVPEEKRKQYTLINHSVKLFFFLGLLILFFVRFVFTGKG